jgi:hypothetical protein
MRALFPLMLAVTAAGCASAAQRPCARVSTEEETWLKDWALSRCLAQAAQGEKAGKDASETAAAFLERGSRPWATYEKLEDLVRTFLARQYSGSADAPGDYNTLKCIELFHSREVERLAHEASHGQTELPLQ